MEASQDLKDFIIQNKELILAVEQDSDKANKLMLELKYATKTTSDIDFYYETLNLFKELYGVDEFVRYVDELPVGFYRMGTFSIISIPKNIKRLIYRSISGCNINTLTINSKDTSIYAFGIKKCTIDTLTFNGDTKMYKHSLFQCKIKSWKILGDLTIKSPSQTFLEYIKNYKDCEFIIKNSAKVVLEDTNFSVDLTAYLKDYVTAANIKIV